MALYKCPVCGKKGILTVRGDFYEWAAPIFGQFHTYEENSLLPLLCHAHQQEAGKPNTLKEVQAFVDKKKGKTTKAKVSPKSDANILNTYLLASELDKRVPSAADVAYEKNKPKPSQRNPMEYMLKHENKTPIPPPTSAPPQQAKKKEASSGPSPTQRNQAFLAWAKRQIRRG
jgi:hypothetical protein